MDYLWRRNSIIFLLLCIVFWCYIYIGFLVKKAYVEIGLEVPKSTTLQIFWAKEGRGYSEDKMADLFVHPGTKNYSFILTDLTEVDKLRVDPIKSRGEAKLLYLKIYQHGYSPVELTSSSGLDNILPYNQVDGLRLDSSGLTFVSQGDDPGLEYHLAHTPGEFVLLTKAVVVLILIFTTWLLGILCSRLLIRYRFVVVLLFGAWMLIWVMSLTT